MWLKNSNICIALLILWSTPWVATDPVWRILWGWCSCHWIYTMWSEIAYSRWVFPCPSSPDFPKANVGTHRQGHLVVGLQAKHCPYISMSYYIQNPINNRKIGTHFKNRHWCPSTKLWCLLGISNQIEFIDWNIIICSKLFYELTIKILN